MKPPEQEREAEKEREKEKFNEGTTSGIKQAVSQASGHHVATRAGGGHRFVLKQDCRVSCAVLTEALLTFLSKCESELAPDLGDQGCVSDQVSGRAWPRVSVCHLGCSEMFRTRQLGSGHSLAADMPVLGFVPTTWGQGCLLFLPTLQTCFLN